MKGKICPLPRAVSVQSDRDIEAQETARKCCQNANMCAGAEEDNQGDNSTHELREKNEKQKKTPNALLFHQHHSPLNGARILKTFGMWLAWEKEPDLEPVVKTVGKEISPNPLRAPEDTKSIGHSP